MTRPRPPQRHPTGSRRMDQEVRAHLHHAGRIVVRIRKRIQERRRRLPSREANAAGNPTPPDAVSIVPQTPDGKLLLIRGISLSAEQLVHRVSGRPHGAGRKPGGMRRSRASRRNRVRAANQLGRSSNRPAAASRLLVHGANRRDRARCVRPGRESGGRATGTRRAHRAVPARHCRRPAIPCRKHHPVGHPRPVGAGSFRAQTVAASTKTPRISGPRDFAPSHAASKPARASPSVFKPGEARTYHGKTHIARFSC